MAKIKAAKHIHTTDGWTEDQIHEKWSECIVEISSWDSKVWNYCKRNTPKHLWSDLLQDLVIILAKNKQKVVAAYLNNQHNFFITRIIINQIGSSTSPFFTRFRQPVQESPSDTDIAAAGDANWNRSDLEYKEELELQWNLLNEAIKHSNITFYEDRILRMYFEQHLIAADISKQLNISAATVYNTIQRVVEKLKSEIKFFLQNDEWPKENDEIILACRYPVAWFDADGNKRSVFYTFNEMQRKTGLMPATVRQYLNYDRKMKDGSYFMLDVDPAVLQQKKKKNI
jgi:DNA-binding CsgD family transcriptional regulator